MIKYLKRLMPHGLMGRAMIMTVTPMLVTLAIGMVVFFDRHWSDTTHRLTQSLAGEIALIRDRVYVLQSDGVGKEDMNLWLDTSGKRLGLRLSLVPQNIFDKTKKQDVNPYINWALPHLERALAEQIEMPAQLFYDYETGSDWVGIAVDTGLVLDATQTPLLLEVMAPYKRIFSSTTYVFVVMMGGGGMMLMLTAMLFMRNQIRPIRRLARMAEAFGRGDEPPKTKPHGASEIRQAIHAFMVMQTRIRRFVTQRTEFLAAVSHDLRTPLTRMRLNVEMYADEAHTRTMPLETRSALREISQDVALMQRMIEAFLAFARGQSMPLALQDIPISSWTQQVVDRTARTIPEAQKNVTIDFLGTTPPDSEHVIQGDPDALDRMLTNLLTNALNYARSRMTIALVFREKTVEIMIEDDGDGIDAAHFEAVFKPFVRLDAARGQNTSVSSETDTGTGLGLSIARDIARFHGGDIRLVQGKNLGGLTAVIRLPRVSY